MGTSARATAAAYVPDRCDDPPRAEPRRPAPKPSSQPSTPTAKEVQEAQELMNRAFEAEQERRRRQQGQAGFPPAQRQQGDEEEEEGQTIPESVSNRMIRRVSIFSGVPLLLGLAFFPAFYYVKTQARQRMIRPGRLHHRCTVLPTYQAPMLLTCCSSTWTCLCTSSTSSR